MYNNIIIHIIYKTLIIYNTTGVLHVYIYRAGDIVRWWKKKKKKNYLSLYLFSFFEMRAYLWSIIYNDHLYISSTKEMTRQLYNIRKKALYSDKNLKLYIL